MREIINVFIEILSLSLLKYFKIRVRALQFLITLLTQFREMFIEV